MNEYFESAEEIIITKKRAVLEYTNHGCTEADLIDDLGDHSAYEAQTVLIALGY